MNFPDDFLILWPCLLMHTKTTPSIKITVLSIACFEVPHEALMPKIDLFFCNDAETCRIPVLGRGTVCNVEHVLNRRVDLLHRLRYLRPE